MANLSNSSVRVIAINSNVQTLCDDDVLVELDVEITDGDYASAGRVSLQLRGVDDGEPLIVPGDEDLAPELQEAFRWLGRRRYAHAVERIVEHAIDAARAQTAA